MTIFFKFYLQPKKIITNSTRFSGGGGVNECLPAGMTKFIYINSIALNKRTFAEDYHTCDC
jgi:hypothetical protein